MKLPLSLQILETLFSDSETEKKTGTAAQDLESFAAHAGRSTVKTDDVLLLGRRNEGLETILKEFVEGLKERKAKESGGASGKGKGKRRGKGLK